MISMPAISEKNKRIAKNSIALYFRMMLLMIISLYTSRVTLSVLGFDDFGIYQVVGGIIVVFSFLNVALSSSTQRFLNYEMGLSNFKGLKEVFSNSLVLHCCIAIVLVLLGESVGLWFLNNMLSIPEERLHVANLVYQFSILSFIINVLNVPLNASIIAHEKMSAFAYISVVEALLKLLMVFLLSVINYDKLLLYGVLSCAICIIIHVTYWAYCCGHFSECKPRLSLVSKKRLYSLSSFSGWTLLGGVRSVGHTQGISILINMFFGVAVNAAQGITNQVTTIVNNVVYNFLTALNPQIVQLYASKKVNELHRLMLRGCRISIFLVALFSVPLLLETDVVLKLWLKDVPEYTTIFIRLSLLAVLIQPYATVLQTAKSASGNVKCYHLVLALVGFSHIPLAYYAFSCGLPPYTAMVIYVFLIICIQIARILFACNAVNMRLIVFAKEITKNYAIVALAALPALFLHRSLKEGVITMILVVVVNTIFSLMSFFFMGFPKDERKKIFYMAESKFLHEGVKKEQLEMDERFYIDKQNLERLTSRRIKKYEVVEIEIGRILRDLGYRNEGIVNLKNTYVYAYLTDEKGGKEKYQEYCKICNVAFRNSEEYDKLINSLLKNDYDIRKGAICVDSNNLIIEGQHRACILLKKRGPLYKIPVVKIYYAGMMKFPFMLKLLHAKMRNKMYMAQMKKGDGRDEF